MKKSRTRGGKAARSRSKLQEQYSNGSLQSVKEEFPKRIVLGVCGGIAAYKSANLVRRLIDAGAEVRVVMTQAALQFVSATTFQAVSSQRVHVDLWDAEAEAAMSHIELARWADLILVAPATAHFVGALAHGLAADLLQTLCLATNARIALAPAMNHVMWANPAVQDNCARLESRGVILFGPTSGDQACGENGPGRMMEPDDIVAAISSSADRRAVGRLDGVKTVITAGPTREPIDPVRYVTNRSSGKMGYALAAAARRAGANVVLISGPVVLPTPPGVDRVDVETAQEMYDAVHTELTGTQLFIGCAAVSDYRPEVVSEKKIKRSAEHLRMEFVRSPDTLASVAALPHGPFTVGFAAETDAVEAHARDKLERKGLDMIAANRVGPTCGFDKETNQLSVFWRGGHAHLDECAKTVLSTQLIDLIAERYMSSRSDESSSN